MSITDDPRMPLLSGKNRMLVYGNPVYGRGGILNQWGKDSINGTLTLYIKS